jgi:hypothetical protein
MFSDKVLKLYNSFFETRKPLKINLKINFQIPPRDCLSPTSHHLLTSHRINARCAHEHFVKLELSPRANDDFSAALIRDYSNFFLSSFG